MNIENNTTNNSMEWKNGKNTKKASSQVQCSALQELLSTVLTCYSSLFIAEWREGQAMSSSIIRGRIQDMAWDMAFFQHFL